MVYNIRNRKSRNTRTVTDDQNIKRCGPMIEAYCKANKIPFETVKSSIELVGFNVGVNVDGMTRKAALLAIYLRLVDLGYEVPEGFIPQKDKAYAHLIGKGHRHYQNVDFKLTARTG